jgi:DNA-binding transcriptional MocR family regulator
MDASFIALLNHWATGRGPLHDKLARAIQRIIRTGSLPPATRLPAERRLAQALAISRTTVVTAYSALREQGWLETRRGSGAYVSSRSRVVKAARQDAQTKALAASPMLGLFTCEIENTVDLALGTPAPLTELPPELFQLPQGEHDAVLRDRMYYPLGLPALRRAVAGHYARSGLPTQPEQILVTNGAQQAVSLAALLYVERGDTVLIEDPAYFGALDAFRTAGARLCSLPVGASGVSPAVLRDRMPATAARLVYLTPTFQNPTGAVMPVAARRAIAKMAADFGVPVIDDNSLADLILEGQAPPPVACYGGTGAILTIGCISKLIWPGLRVGWIHAPKNVIERLARLKAALDLGSPLWTQAIAVRLIAAIPEARRLLRKQLLPRRNLLADLLQKRLSDWEFRLPTGGFFLWARLPPGDARELSQLAVRHGVLILPGSMMSASRIQSRYVRLPFLAEPATLRLGIDRLAAAWREHQSSARTSARGGRLDLAVV